MEFNKVLQAEEVEALSAIYGKDWASECGTSPTYRVQVCVGALTVLLVVTMPPDYPAQSPPQYELSAPWMDRGAKKRLHTSLDAVYLDNIGQPTIFNWVEKIRWFLQSMKSARPKAGRGPGRTPSQPATTCPCPPITHGDVVTDRKSSFQGHAAQVTSIEEVHAVLVSLKSNKKILNAKHNMYAYRIEVAGKTTSILQDFDDDGEAHAGGRMLHLLEKMDQRNTVVVVTRWFGGIQIGPDRFRHITNATRQAIEAAGLLRPSNGASNGATNGKNNNKKKK